MFSDNRVISRNRLPYPEHRTLTPIDIRKPVKMQFSTTAFTVIMASLATLGTAAPTEGTLVARG